MALGVDGGGVFDYNDTYDYDDSYEYRDEFELGASTALWTPVLYLVTLLTGLLANALLLAALSRKRRSWSITDVFFLHLSIADVLLLLTLPVLAAQAIQRCGWCFRLALVSCKISRAFFYVSSVNSCQTLRLQHFFEGAKAKVIL